MPDQFCRLCLSNQLSECLVLEGAPRNIQRLLTEKQLPTDSPITLKVYQCRDCSFVQLSERLEDDYYDEYWMTATHSAQMREFQRAQALDFVQRFNLSGKRIIEVGCGDGNYLRYLHEAGAIPCGIEPSGPFRQTAAARGFQIADGYVGRAFTVQGAPFDAFVTRQVFEHVQDPNDFLLGIHRILSPAGVGLVEVPSLEQALEGGRFYDFFPDHVNYFSALTFRHALERNGFEVLEVARGMNGEFNIALVRKAPEVDFVAMQRTLDLIVKDLHEFVETQHRQGRRVAVWGAGGKGLTVMAVAQLSSVAYVIDSDPHKHGRFTPVSHLPVFAPERLLSDPVDALILTALAYRDEILRQLRDDLRFEGTIAVLGPRLQVLEKEFRPSEMAAL